MVAQPASHPRRRRFELTGVVQGVGFRPFVFRLATELGLAGWVLNDESGVTIEVEGPGPVLDRFGRRLRCEGPPLSSIDLCRTSEVAPAGDERFEIRDSTAGRRPTALVTPDTATCDDCLAELFDPSDRRFRYPFINCTNCGPRFTIVRGIPYDRPGTTMAGFEMCERCRAEYEDPRDRRFHAQPNACPDCGPTARLIAAPAADVFPRQDHTIDRSADAVAGAAAALLDGAIVAVKGLGGYHFACLASDEQAVRRLRTRKHREDKPFAVMVPDPASAERLARLDPLERQLLASRERPIVLVRRRRDAAVAEAVAPGHRDLGLMLAYTPLHHLLLADVGAPLVMTSGNVSDEPIAFRDDEARERLSGIADLFLAHDRPIHTRTDDSVLRVVSVGGGRRPLMLRRSRGYVPVPVPLPVPVPRPALAAGAHLKNTFALAEGRRAWIGHHIGDLENYETLRSFEEGIEHFETLFEVRPDVVAHDLHPDYLSTRYATRRAEAGGVEAVAVQHHHAHLAACLAEHDRSGPVLSAIFDGTGAGPDGTVWGGEFLAGDASGFERAGHLWPVRLPGGEAAIRRPWHMAAAWLCALDESDPEIPDWLADRIDRAEWRAVVRLARSGPNAPVTTSVGRLFDAVSALCGFRLETNYEGQAAIELEMAASSAQADEPEERGYVPPVVREGRGPFRLDARSTVDAVVRDLAAGVEPAVVAVRFHLGLAAGTAVAAVDEARRRGLDTVVLSGGVFQNVLLLERTDAALRRAGLSALVPQRVPPGDGGIAFGQLAVLAARAGAASPA